MKRTNTMEFSAGGEEVRSPAAKRWAVGGDEAPLVFDVGLKRDSDGLIDDTIIIDTQRFAGSQQRRAAEPLVSSNGFTPEPMPSAPRYRPSTTSMTESELDEAALQSAEASVAVAAEKMRRAEVARTRFGSDR